MITGITPYKNMSDFELFESIKNDQLPYPAEVDPVAKDLIVKLLDKDTKKRIGCGESGR